MNRVPSPLYRNLPDDAFAALETSIERGLNNCGKNTVPVFFRADDIGVISDSFIRLMELFSCHQLPLNLAVVPAWISAPRWSAIGDVCELSSPLWCWHQHGWRHRNFQQKGKKCEFGSLRQKNHIAADLVKGRDRLKALLGPHFSLFFTPPWNRCTDDTLFILKSAGFKAVSRDSTAKTDTPILPDFPVNTDLHTRREQSPDDSLRKLGAEVENGIRSGMLGIMIHHQLMNRNAFLLLDGLLQMIAGIDSFIPVNFNDLHHPKKL